MLCRDIYKAALALIGEIGDPKRTADYSERAPYILANSVCELKHLDENYRKANSLPEAPELPTVFVSLSLTEPFPLADRFFGVVSEYLAALLIIEENSTLSDKLYNRFCLSMAAITAEIPAERQKILDKYPM